MAFPMVVPTRNSIGILETADGVLYRSLTVNRDLNGEAFTSFVRDGDPPWAHNGRTTGEDGGGYARPERRSSRATFVVVMKTADVWDCDDRATGWKLGIPIEWSILVQR
jgi:hypothetical protein